MESLVFDVVYYALAFAVLVLMITCFRICLDSTRHAARAHARRVRDKRLRLIYWIDPLSMFRDRYYTEEGQVHRRRAECRIWRALRFFGYAIVCLAPLVAMSL